MDHLASTTRPEQNNYFNETATPSGDRLAVARSGKRPELERSVREARRRCPYGRDLGKRYPHASLELYPDEISQLKMALSGAVNQLNKDQERVQEIPQSSGEVRLESSDSRTPSGHANAF